MRHRGNESRSEKADRLLQNHRVLLTGPGRGLVIGDHDTYEVVRAPKGWACTCRWGTYSRWSRCSHVLAVRRAIKDPLGQEPVARLVAPLESAGRPS